MTSTASQPQLSQRAVKKRQAKRGKAANARLSVLDIKHRNITSTSPLRYDSHQGCAYPRVVMRGLQHTNAFVIQFRGASELSADGLPGRIEHVASGHTETFQSVEELPQLLLKMLRSVASDEGNGIG